VNIAADRRKQAFRRDWRRAVALCPVLLLLLLVLCLSALSTAAPEAGYNTPDSTGGLDLRTGDPDPGEDHPGLPVSGWAVFALAPAAAPTYRCAPQPACRAPVQKPQARAPPREISPA